MIKDDLTCAALRLPGRGWAVAGDSGRGASESHPASELRGAGLLRVRLPPGTQYVLEMFTNIFK